VQGAGEPCVLILHHGYFCPTHRKGKKLLTDVHLAQHPASSQPGEKPAPLHASRTMIVAMVMHDEWENSCPA